MAKKSNKKTQQDDFENNEIDFEDEEKPKKKTKAKRKKGINPVVIFSVVIVILVAYVLYINRDALFGKTTEESLIAARVNGEDITLDEVNEAHSKLSESYKELVTREDILNEIISEKLLLQEASRRGIIAAREEAENIIKDAVAQSNMSEQEFNARLESISMSKEELYEYYRKQLVISKLLNETLFKEISVSENDVRQFYEKNQLAMQNISLDDSSDSIKSMLLSEKKKSAYAIYVGQLKAKADIEVFLGSPAQKSTEEGINQFEETSDSICNENSRPVLRLYITTDCLPCNLAKEAFNSFAKEKQEKGEIAAYIWELNTGDNILTEETESGIPRSELSIFRKYNPKSTVPAFVFGCKYIRVGNAYMQQNNVEAEKLEFEKILKKIAS